MGLITAFVGKYRKILAQVLLVLVVLGFFLMIGINYYNNITARKIGIGFDFLNQTAGFSISQSLIPYQESDTFGRTFLVGLLNTLLASFAAIILASILGFLIGLLRISKNPLLQKISLAYVETLRNIPPLLHVLFWYQVVFLNVLPDIKSSYILFDVIYLNVRGITMPELVPGAQFGLVLGIWGLTVLGLVLFAFRARSLRLRGLSRKVWPFQAGLVALALVCTQVLQPWTFANPEIGRFGFTTGFTLRPELFSLVFALSTYTSTYLAEIVRSSIQSVPKGQVEAAMSLGFSPLLRMRLVIVPQALRTMIPPATNQYLNIIKNSSLGVAIAYPDLTAVFAGTTLNQTGRALEVMVMVMFTYLSISLLTSVLMNWYNAHILHPEGKLVEVPREQN